MLRHPSLRHVLLHGGLPRLPMAKSQGKLHDVLQRVWQCGDVSENGEISMNPSTKRRINRRFNELLVKECTGTATPEEISKLERYQKLRCGDQDHWERKQIARLDWETRQMKKLLGKFSGMFETAKP